MARLIVVSGPNGAGKTTLIKNSLEELKQLGYEIIIPDEIVSISDTPISDEIILRQDGNKESLSILKSNKLFGNLSYKRMAKILRLMLRLKR